MACEAVQRWSLSGLVAAFLDLAIAYLLLLASAVAYLASKFLGFFWLHLPCPCDGVFFNIRSKSFCLNRLLVEFPCQIVWHVLLSVKENFPFHNSIRKNRNYTTVGETCVNGVLEMEGEASCSSLSDARKPADVIRIRELSPRAEKYDLKGKGVIGHRPRTRLRQHRKGGSGLGKNFGVKVCNPPVLEADTDDNKAITTMGVMKTAAAGVEMNPSHDEDIFTNPRKLSMEGQQNDQQETLSGDEKSTIRLLEQRLEEERIARAALYVELEKERSAAATAADEAMAMILRLQEEKASIEIEDRQYQRILEEKSIYDAEEMTILKEILLRREKEKYFLEKEVEAYRQMVCSGDEQIAGGGFDPNDDPILIPHKLTGFTEKKVTVENKFSDGLVFMDKPTSELNLANESFLFEKQGDLDEQSAQMSVCSSSGIMDLQEKKIITVDNELQLASNAPQDCEKGVCFGGKELEQIQDQNPGHKLSEKVIVSYHGSEAGDHCYATSLKQQEEDTYIGFSNSCDSTLDKDSQVHDVHVDGINLCSEANSDKSKQPLVCDSAKDHKRNSSSFEAAVTRRIGPLTDFPSSSIVESEFDAKKSNSEITPDFPPNGPRGLSLLSEQRHNSITPVDREMVKINSEVGWLQERLKLVQEGREKLSLAGENQERANIQLKLLEDIAHQVQEIRHLTETGKAARQAGSRKRRSRSVSSRISSEG